jgi:hypothetical protein
MIDATARTFPMTKLYDVAAELTSLGIGEALVTVLGPNGVPTPTVHCVMRPPRSLMAQLDAAAFAAAVGGSKLAGEYATDVDPQAAKEMLTSRMAQAQAQSQAQAAAAATQAQIEKEYAKSQAQVARAYAKAQADAARAQARDEARSRRSYERYGSGGSESSGGGLDLGEAAKLGTRILTSSTTNTLLRGIFGTLTGSPARRTRRR